MEDVNRLTIKTGMPADITVSPPTPGMCSLLMSMWSDGEPQLVSRQPQFYYDLFLSLVLFLLQVSRTPLAPAEV